MHFPQSFCRGGLARRDITPPVGIYHRMWGAATHDRSTGVHRPLMATALALSPSVEGRPESAAAAAALSCSVSIDHCLLWSERLDSLARRRSAGWRLSSRRNCRHVFAHARGRADGSSAGRPAGRRADRRLSRPDGPANRRRRARSAASVAPGANRLRHWALRAWRRIGTFGTRQSGQFVCGFNPAGASDDTLLVARISDRQSRRLGTIVNYACHPTTLAWDNTLISPDFVGAMREVVEARRRRAVPVSARCLGRSWAAAAGSSATRRRPTATAASWATRRWRRSKGCPPRASTMSMPGR